MAAKFEMTSDFSRVLADYDKLQKQVVRLDEQNRKLVETTKRSDTTTTSWLDKAVSGYAMAAVGAMSFHKAIALVNEGLAEQLRLSQEAARVQTTAADAQTEVIHNLGNVQTAVAGKFIQDLDEIAKKSKVANVAPLYQAAASVLSGVGSGQQQLTKAIIAESTPLFRNKMEQLPEFAGAVGDIATIVGANTPAEVRSTIGLVLSTMGESRIEKLSAFKNIAPALAAVATVDTGPDRMRAVKEGAALSAAIGGAIKDPEGALTKTAVSEIATTLQEMLPEKDILDIEGKVRRKGTGMQTLRARMQAVQADEKLQREFFEATKKGEGAQGASFRGAITPVVRSLMTDPRSEAARRFVEAEKVISADPRFVDQMLRNLEGATPQLASTARMRGVAGRVEAMQMAPEERIRADVEEIVRPALQQTRRSIFGGAEELFRRQTVERQQMLLGMGAPERGISALQERLNQVREGDLGTDKTLRMIEFLKNAIDELKGLRRDMKSSPSGTSTVAAAQLSQQREGR